jgi:hypothetical protein
MMRAYEPNLGMEALVIELVIICDLYYRGHEGLETLRYRCILNVLFLSSLTSLFLFESYSYAVFLVRGHIPWHGVRVEIP